MSLMYKTPSPSIRHISSRRVNTVTSDRQALIDRNNLELDYQSITAASRMPINDNISIHNISNSNTLHHPPIPNQKSPSPTHLSPPTNSSAHKDNTDVESIIYQFGLPTQMIHTHSNLQTVYPPLAEEESVHDYVPGSAQNLEGLQWSEMLPYYLPFLSWVKHYTPAFFIGDLIGGLTLVFFQLPLSLSYATSLAHVPVLSGLLSLGISPLIYLIFGSVPQMVVGPEGPISLIVGQAVEPLLHHSNKKELDPMEYVVAITFVSGASLLGFGLGRFGFLDNVLSASLLKGFISGVGLVMVINSLVVVMGLEELLKKISDDPSAMDIHSPFDKVRFLFGHYNQLHELSFTISMTGFVIIMAIRIFKKYAAKNSKKNSFYDKAVFIPEILIVVGISTWLCSIYRWDQEGIKIIGTVHKGGALQLYNPFTAKMWPLIKSLSTSGFLCAMLGFFESTTASKSLGSTYDLPISSNRELVALGSINIVGSFVGALPAFGGYGRSKINAIFAKTTLSGGIMGICTLFTIGFLLDFLYFVPECMLSVITAVIGISLMEEAPFEVYFHWKARGYNELITFGVTVLTTLFFSMEGGIAVGLIYSLIRVIRHSAQSRIQILGRYPGSNTFLDADIPDAALIHLNANSNQGGVGSDFTNDMAEKLKLQKYNYFGDENFTHLNTHVLEEIEGCLIIRIPEPLTFTNSSDLRSRLKRVEMYGSTKAHPAMKPRRNASMTNYIIFDLKGMTEIDSSAAQILKDLILGYRGRKIHSFFVRVNKNAKLRKRLLNTGIVDLLIADLDALNYFDSQKRQAYSRMKRRRSLTESPEINFEGEGADDDDEEAIPIDIDESSEIYDLIETKEEPYFDHISDALKVIDFYEVNSSHNSARTGDYLEVDQTVKTRSSLPPDTLV
ncbi:putative sulfate transporter [Scheffersomyces coipomensis]|uniref:putative sulfate transporter n=1 Tax=Scheffersomyces coipomensis TaxID=1788519 RepID=UPI00315CBB42